VKATAKKAETKVAAKLRLKAAKAAKSVAAKPAKKAK
jgi:hypothetical protein